MNTAPNRVPWTRPGRARRTTGDGRVGVVIATRNRRRELCRTLGHLDRLPERPRIVVVDNGSTDGTTPAVRTGFPAVDLLTCSRNLGAVARNLGVAASTSRYVAFSDDDSWWEPGALARAADLLDAYPGIGLLAAHTVVGRDRVADPITAAMADGALGRPARLPGPPVLGFLACSAVVRRDAFQSVGGFHRLLFFVGEERLLAYDLAAAGWDLMYAADVVAVHRPSPVRPPESWRRRLERRNEVLTAWLRRPLPVALHRLARLTRDTPTDRDARAALLGALIRLPAAVLGRRRLPPDVESAARLLEARQLARAG